MRIFLFLIIYISYIFDAIYLIDKMAKSKQNQKIDFLSFLSMLSEFFCFFNTLPSYNYCYY